MDAALTTYLLNLHSYSCREMLWDNTKCLSLCPKETIANVTVRHLPPLTVFCTKCKIIADVRITEIRINLLQIMR